MAIWTSCNMSVNMVNVDNADPKLMLMGKFMLL